MTTFGRLVRGQRIAQGLQQKDVAASLKMESGRMMSAQYLTDIEQDRRSPPGAGILLQMADVLNLPADVLFFAAGKLPPDIAAAEEVTPERIVAAFRAFRAALYGTDADREGHNDNGL